MKKIFYLLLSVLLFNACQINKNKKTETNLSDIAGVYKTTYPCADCSGIEANLTLTKNKTFVYNRLYKDKKDGRFIDKGKYTVKDSILTIKLGDDPIYFLIGENMLTLLDNNLKSDTGMFALYYQLKKQQKFNYEGNYATYYEAEDSYRGTLSILPKGTDYEVNFSASKVKNRENCRFSGIGSIKNDTLWVNISNEADKEVWMYIAPSHDNLGVEVFTKNFEERFQMMFYCGGGGSLAGKYFKNTVTNKSIGVFDNSATIKEVLHTVPFDQIRKKAGHGEFKDDIYDDYEIYDHNARHLFTLTPKDTAQIEQKINRVLIKSPFFKTDKGINCKSTYKDIKNAYTITKIEPTREHIVLIVNDINANFSIPKTKLKKGWWNDKTKTVNTSKIPLNAQIDDFILWWNN